MAVATAVVIIIVIIMVVMVVVFVLVIIVVVMVDEMSVLIDHRSEVVVVAFAVRIITFAVPVIVVMVAFAVRIVTLILIMVMVVAFAVGIITFAVPVVVIVVMVVFKRFLVDEIVNPGIINGMEHLVGKLMLVDIKDRTHEIEVDLIRARDGTVMFDTVVHVDQIEGDTFTHVVDDSGLDVAEETSALALNEFAYGNECCVEFGLGIGVEVVELTAETGSTASRLLDGVLFMSAHCISS